MKYKHKKKWKDIKISQQLRDVIHGYVASDGYVRADGRLTVDQSIDQAKFVDWLYEKFKDLRTETPIALLSRKHQKTGKSSLSKRFNTRSLLKGFHKMWYQSYVDSKGQTKYVKRLPKRMEGFFSSTFITLWFAGDGTKMVGQRGAKFEVTSLTVSERKQLQRLFKTKFGIKTEINRAGQSITGTQQWTLSINSPDYDRFRQLITEMDLIPTLFPHKLHPLTKAPFKKGRLFQEKRSAQRPLRFS